MLASSRRRRLGLLLASLALLVLPVSAAKSETLTLAVATNFKAVMEVLAPAFEQESGHSLRVSAGSTGKLYAQIREGAPFSLFLAADEERPLLLVEEGLAVPESLKTYAVGRLALWSADERFESGEALLAALERGDFARLAIANPDLAPYGLAARETLEALGVFERYRQRIVMGQNIGQTYAMVSTGNAELGLVALSYLMRPGEEAAGPFWEVPEELYRPIRQDLVLLTAARDSAAARAFLAFLEGKTARDIILSFGYRVD